MSVYSYVHRYAYINMCAYVHLRENDVRYDI